MLKIEAGKYYKTRAGDKAFVSAVICPDPFGSAAAPAYPVIGFIKDRSIVFTWNKNGQHVIGEDDAKGDLVAEWVEPVKLTKRVFLLRNQGSPAGTFTAELDSDYRPSSAIGSALVTVTEGEFN